jgi:hypothetical protein
MDKTPSENVMKEEVESDSESIDVMYNYDTYFPNSNPQTIIKELRKV